MNSIKRANLLALYALSFLFIVSCASTGGASGSASKAKAKIYDPTGTWEYTVETPDGANGGVLKLEGNPGAYVGTLETDQFGVLEINDLDIQDTNLTGSIEVMGIVAEIECTFDGDSMTGSVYFGEDNFPMEGVRVSK